EKIDAALIAALKASCKTVYIALHANHVRELTPEARAAFARLDLFGVDDRNTRVKPDDLHMSDAGKRLHDLAETARGKNQRIAAG
ncbi:hypothetical protein ACC754_41080, partial [Rhizobium johnstonii]